MKFATFEHDGVISAGVVAGTQVHPVQGTVLELVRSGLAAAIEVGTKALGHNGIDLDQIRLLPPLQPPTIRDFVAFEEHVEGVVASVSGGSGVAPEWYEAPTFYFTNPYALVGAHDDVAVPPGSELLDFELEVAVVIGVDGTSVSPEAAPSHIFGYTVFNDWSARDLQRREMRVNLGPAKGKDSATTLGPWLVTADEVAQFHDEEGFLALDMRVWVNDELIGQDLLSNMGWPFADLIAYASRGTWVRAGDVLGSGTCGNGGCLGELWGRNGEIRPPSLQVGDRVRMSVEGLGTIENTVVAGIVAPTVPPARVRSRRRERSS